VPHDFLVMTRGIMAKKSAEEGQKADGNHNFGRGRRKHVISFTDQELQPSEIGAYKDVQVAALKKTIRLPGG